MFARAVPGGWVGGIAALLMATSAHAGFRIVSQVAAVDATARDVTFTVTFNEPPDFIGRDALGRPDNSFQYEIVPDVPQIRAEPVSAIRAVVRGDEIGSSDDLPIRDGTENGADPSHLSGGWGRIRGSVPFSLEGSKLTFTAPFSTLDAPSGHFAYRVFTAHYGALTSEVDAAIIPTPTALSAGGIAGLLAGFVLVKGRRRAV